MTECNLEWYLEEGQLSVHVFPFRTFIFSGDVDFNQIAPFVAGVCCLNVILAQNKEMSLIVKSKQPIPEKMRNLAEDISAVSQGRFRIRFENTAPMPLPTNEKSPILLFSGGKDSLWLLNQIRESNEEFQILYVSGSAIAGEYRKEVETIRSMNLGLDVKSIHIDYVDYGDVSMAFKYRARWKSLMLIVLGRLFSRDIRIGISPVELSTEGDNLLYYSERSQTIEIVRNVFDCRSISGVQSEFRCYLETRGQTYRSCYSPDLLCDPANDFTNSCWKCRTLHIYEKYANDEALTKEETDYLRSDSWMGDNSETIGWELQLFRDDRFTRTNDINIQIRIRR
jgi:hypothetical protein